MSSTRGVGRRNGPSFIAFPSRLIVIEAQCHQEQAMLSATSKRASVSSAAVINAHADSDKLATRTRRSIVPHGVISDGIRVLTAHNLKVDYSAVIKAQQTWSNWIASLYMFFLIAFSTSVNLYFQLRYTNTLHVTSADRYSSDQEWLFGAIHTAPLNISIIYAFLTSDDNQDVTRLKMAIQATPPGPFDNSTACVARVGLDAGSYYGLCDRLDPSKLPPWARDFDALALQTIFLATVEQFRQRMSTPVIGIAQAFRNQRTGWYQQESIERLHCTTKQLAGGASSTNLDDRVLFTRAHGLMRSVDCTTTAEASNEACQAIRELEPFVLFSDGTGILRAYEVVRTTTGRDLILSPFSTKERIGERTDTISQWPFDDCLYVRGGSLGWFGAGYVTYFPQIPTLALYAKLELAGLLFVIWFVKFRCVFYRLHDALEQMSRLGFFIFLMIQVVGSAYQEHDIMRTIYSWEIRSWDDWILFWYIESSLALAGGLMALAVLRFVFGLAICRVGVALATALPIVIGLTELWVAARNYKTYTLENGLLRLPSTECGPGYTGCGNGKFNYLHCVGLLTLLPAFIVWINNKLTSRSQAGTCQVRSMQPPELTTFEQICLDETEVTALVRDCDKPYVDIAGVRHVSAILVSTCGFTVIKDRFLVRTKDLVLVLGPAVLPAWVMRDVSIVAWPLCWHRNGTVGVSPARKVLLRHIRSVAISLQHETSSLIRSEEQPLA